MSLIKYRAAGIRNCEWLWIFFTLSLFQRIFYIEFQINCCHTLSWERFMRRLEYISTRIHMTWNDFKTSKKNCLESPNSIILQLTLKMERKEHCKDELKDFPVSGPKFRPHRVCVSTAALGGITHTSSASRSVQHTFSHVALTPALRKEIENPNIFTVKIIYFGKYKLSNMLFQ